MRARVEAVLLPVLAVLLVAAVVVAVVRRGDDPPTLPAPKVVVEQEPLVYDGSLEPAAAVLTLVPRDASTLTVTDLGLIREQLGEDDLTGGSPPEERDDFWARARADTALLTDGLLRDDDAVLSDGYGFTEDDVEWEAHFFDQAGSELGWALVFRSDLDMSLVQNAVDAGIGPLAEASTQADLHLVSAGTTPFPAASWAAVDGTDDLVGSPADSTYLQRGCLPGTPGEADAGLEPLRAFSMAFGSTLATARLGVPRPDVFERLDLDDQVPGFAEAYDGGVADPSTGRLGYRMVDPVAAADLALRGQLPFAACADPATPARG